MAPKENSLKKFTEANFCNLVSYLLYTYLQNVYRKIMWAKLDVRILQSLALQINATDKLRQNTIIKCFFSSIVSLSGVCDLLDGHQSVHRGFLFNSAEIQGRLPIFANVWSEVLV